MTPPPPTSSPSAAAASDPSAPRHFAFVDSLRGLAIVGVVLVHASFCVPGFHGFLRGAAAQGQYGVQLFFVVSAFTLFWSLRSRTGQDRRPLAAFYARRFFRIAPLFWTAAAFYAITTGGRPTQWAPTGLHWPQVAATLAFVHGWWPTTINSVVPGGWSIAAEAMFYLCIPVLFARVRSLDGAAWLTLATAVAVGLLLPRVPKHIAHHFPPAYGQLVEDFTFYTFPAQLPVFCVGLAVYFLLAEPDGPRRRLGGPVLAAAAACLVFGPVAKHVLPAVAFAMLAVGLARRPVGLLVNPVTRYLGTVSFSGYIWHFWVMARVAGPAVDLMRRLHVRNADVQFCGVVAAVAVGTLPIATLSYHLIEVPGQRIGKWVIRRMDWGAGPRPRPAIVAAGPVMSAA